MNVNLVLTEVPRVGTERRYWHVSVRDWTDDRSVYVSHHYDDEREALDTTLGWCAQRRYRVVGVVRRPLNHSE